MIAAGIAFILDCILGDPRTNWHPVVLIGRLIGWLEHVFYRPKESDARKFFMGLLVVILVLLISYDVALGIMEAAYSFQQPYLVYGVEAFFLSFMISPRSLAEAGRELRSYLLEGNMAEARRKVGWIVGRDTAELDVAGVTRATVETIAENTVDGVISPLFFFALGGLPLAVLYRAANTMDSMLGYRNAKYLYFGRAAARLDDVLNYIPARLTGLLFVAAAWLWKYDAKNAWAMLRRDAAKHPSPNGGYAEATVAGALGIRLGGINSYFGVPSFRAYMGEPLHELGPEHIQGAIRLMYTATGLFLAVLLAAVYIGGLSICGLF